MKRKVLWLIALVMMTAGTASAQMEMQVTLTRATAAPFPTSALAYYNNPMNYFNLTITPVDGRSHDIFLEMSLSSDATTTRIWTDNRFVGIMPKINIPATGKKFTGQEFVQHFYRRLNTNLSESYRGSSDLTLLEGTYHLCIAVHDYYDTAQVLGSNCLHFDICYSGLAPEFTAPSLTPSGSGFDKLKPARKTNFSWTGVVSNCFEPNTFDYVIKFVEVYQGQNVQEAIDENPVKAALDCGHRTFFTFDYRTNPYLRLDSGHVYAVQVEATPGDPDRVVNLTNDGKSQYMVFVWDGPSTEGVYGDGGSGGSGGSGSTVGNGDGIDDRKVTEKSNQKKVLASVKRHKIVSPKDHTMASGTTLPVEVKAATGDSVTTVDYIVSLYEFVGDSAVSLSRQPLKRTTVDGTRNRGERTLRLVDDWSDVLTQGSRYLLTVDAAVEYKYNITYRIRSVTFIDNFPTIDHKDSVVVFRDVRNFKEYSVFQWGSGDASQTLNPAQLTSPSALAGEAATIARGENLRFEWNKPSGAQVSDKALSYDLYIYEVDSTGRINQSNSLVERKGLTTTSYAESSLAKLLSQGRLYAACVVTNVANGSTCMVADNGRSNMVMFAIGQLPKNATRPEGMTICNNASASDQAEASVQTKDLVSKSSPLRMGGFSLYVQEATFDGGSQSFSGKGSVKWSPFGKDVDLAVTFTGLKVNGNREVIAGQAQADLTSKGHVKIGIGDRYQQNKGLAYSSVISSLSASDKVRSWYNQSARASKELGSGATNLPMKLPRTATDPQSNQVTVTVQDFLLTPTGAAISLLGIFASIEDNIYLPFVATNICTSPSTFAIDPTVELVLPKDFAVAMNDGCTMNFKGGESSDVCALIFNSGKYAGLRLAAGFDMGVAGLSAVDGGALEATMTSTQHVTDWNDWTAQLSMPPFKVNGAAGVKVVPQGSVIYDHSAKQTPAEVVFPASYQVQDRNAWKGFYIKNYKLAMPTVLSGMYADLNGKQPQDIWIQTSAGAVIDARGISLSASEQPGLAASSNGVDNWSMSIDNVKVRLQGGNAVEGTASGSLGVPMIAGKMPYVCNMTTSEPQFTVTPPEGTLRCPLFQGYIKPDKTSNVAVRQVGDKTQVTVTLNGTINIDFQKMGLAADVKNVKVEGMQIRNYRGTTAADSAAMHFDHFDFYIGTWSKASPQKYIGGDPSAYDDSMGENRGFFFNIESIEPVIDDRPNKAGYRSAGVNFSGTVRLGIGGKDSKGNPRSITARAAFRVGGMVEENSGKIKNNEGSMDSLYLSAQMDLFKLEGKLAQGADKGWYGPLKVTLFDGATATMNAGFGSAVDGQGEQYDWWFLAGGERYKEPAALGDMNYSGFGGLFAYNMKVNDQSLLSRSADDLMSGCAHTAKFSPAKGQWVARGGVAIAHTDPGMFSLDGLVALSMENAHFARAYIYSNIYALSNGGQKATAKFAGNAIGEYRQSAAKHLVHFSQVPAKAAVPIVYGGTYNDSVPVNVNVYDFVEGGSEIPFSMDIVTWSSKDSPSWSIAMGDNGGSKFEVGKDQFRARLSAGSAEGECPYNMEDNLRQSVVQGKQTPAATKNEGSGYYVTTTVAAKGSAKGIFELNAMSDIEANGSLAKTESSSKSGVNGFQSAGTANVLVKALMQVPTSRGDMAVGSLTSLADLSYSGPNPSWASGKLELSPVVFSGKVKAASESVLSFGSRPDGMNNATDEFFCDMDPAKASFVEALVAPERAESYEPLRFSTTMPLTVDGRDDNIADLLVAVPTDNGTYIPRRFCFAMSEDHSSVVVGNGNSSAVKFSQADDGMMVQSANGGFGADSLCKVNISAAIYEKRKGTGAIEDRRMDVFKGKSTSMMRADAYSWGLPLVSGSPAEAFADTTVFLATNEAPMSLDNQVIFTWPYNGDPLVPYNEIDNACYIVIRQDRPDLFDPSLLQSKGQKLMPIVVNQEMGIANAKVCGYEYVDAAQSATLSGSTTAYPYLKVELPSDVVKVKNASKTYSPCRVSLVLVDTAEYAEALVKAKDMALKSDTMFYPFAVAESMGYSLYSLYFRLDHSYATYADVMDSIASESAKSDIGLGYGATKVSVSADGAISSLIPPVNLNRFFAFSNRAYLFDSYSPNDPKLYASDVVLPPIACFAVNGRQTISSEYNNHIPEWLAVNESFYYQLTYFTYNLNRAKWLIHNDTTTVFEPQLIPSQPLASPDLRVLSLGNRYTSMSSSDLDSIMISGHGATGNTRYWFHEGSRYREPFDWAVPSVLQVRADQVVRVNASHFASTNHLQTVTFVKQEPAVYIDDRVSSAAVSDNQALARFFSQIRSYALWYSDLSPMARAYERNASVNLIALTFTNSPYTVYSASLVSAYDSWSASKTRYRSRDYWFDTWLRSNEDSSYTGYKPMWTSSWLESEFSPVNTKKYVKSPNRHPYRYYVANVYYISPSRGERDFLSNVFAICDNSSRKAKPYICHNTFADVKILVNVPAYNNEAKRVLSAPIVF